MKVDIAASLLKSDDNNLSQEELDVLNTIKKVNVVALPISSDNAEQYQTEKKKVKEILSQEKYKTLMKMGSNNKGATLKYMGEEDAIDEIIVFASDEERGFALFRLLGNDMRPDKMIKLMNSIDKGDVDVSKFSGIGEIFTGQFERNTTTEDSFEVIELKTEEVDDEDSETSEDQSS